MKKQFLIIFTLILLVFTNLNAQFSNLVYNGDFEIFTTVPTSSAQINHAPNWYNTGNLNYEWANNYCPPCGTPDFYYNNGNVTNPNILYFMNHLGIINPVSGNGQAGLFIYGSIMVPGNGCLLDYREYMATQLTNPLLQGKKYIISFYLTNGLDSIFPIGCNNFAFNFSSNILHQGSGLPDTIHAVPQIKINSIAFFHNFWYQFRFKYIADSNFNYLTIGNFSSNSQTKDSVFFNTTLLHTLGYGSGSFIDCAYYFIDKIEIYPALDITNGSYNLCIGNSTTLKVNYTDSIVKWATTLNPTNIIAVDSMITVTPNVTTTYIAIASFDTAYFTVNVINPPIINIGNDTTLCQGETLLLDATTPNAVSYMWQDYSNNPTYTVTQAGTYYVKVITAYCTSRDTIHVAYKPLPIVNIGNDTTLCYGQTITLNATLPNASYQWQDGSTNSIFTVTPPYTPYVFWVKATVNNCSGYDTITISYIPAAVTNFARDTVLCNGDSTMLDVTNPNATYLWQDNTTNPTYNANQSGVYSVIITMDGCIFKDTIQVVISPPISVNLGSDTTVCIGSIVVLDPRNLNTTYLWQDGSSGSSYTVSQAGAYWVKISDINKCSATDTINIYFTDCDTSTIIIPNIFTPNGDGYNDYFVIKQTDYKTIEVQIYDRWGIKVFEDNNYQNTWDGKYKGNPLSDGTYFYIIKSKGMYNKKVYNYHGSLTILR